MWGQFFRELSPFVSLYNKTIPSKTFDKGITEYTFDPKTEDSVWMTVLPYVKAGDLFCDNNGATETNHRQSPKEPRSEL